MLQRLEDYFYEDPKRFESCGRAMLGMALTQVVAGAAVRFLATATSAIHSLAPGTLAPEVTAAALLPDLPTFWIPESIFGALLVAYIAFLGVKMVRYGQKLEKAYYR